MTQKGCQPCRGLAFIWDPQRARNRYKDTGGNPLVDGIRNRRMKHGQRTITSICWKNSKNMNKKIEISLVLITRTLGPQDIATLKNPNRKPMRSKGWIAVLAWRSGMVLYRALASYLKQQAMGQVGLNRMNCRSQGTRVTTSLKRLVLNSEPNQHYGWADRFVIMR